MAPARCGDGGVPGLILAAPASGSGKTVVTLGLLRALRRAGVAVAAFKVGPDYIDPAFHAAASGCPAWNLDLWAMRPATVARLLQAIADRAELVLGEGAMGLFDGAASGGGSTADVAALTGWPVLLVMDVRGQGASAAAVLRGFATHRPEVTVAGVVFNRAGGVAHAALLGAAIRPLGIPAFGWLPRSPALALPERHLGLVQAAEAADLEARLEAAADLVERHLDLAALRAAARPARASALGAPAAAETAPLGQRIAVAADAAFAFAYPATLAAWRDAGAELRPFSPLADEAPDAAADAVYLPGGYPELHAGRLAGNARFLGGLRAAAARGAVVYGECGGYMALGTGLVDGEGRRHSMAGLLPLEASFAEPRLHLGYRRAVLAAGGPLGPAGAAWSGHEFHYATVTAEGAGEPLFHCTDSAGRALGPCGRRRGAVLGSFIHLIDRAEGGADDAAR